MPYDFYLASHDYVSSPEPRSCQVLRRARGPSRDDYMVVAVTPPLPGHIYKEASDIQELVLASRFAGTTLFPITEWPMHVYIWRFRDKTAVQQLDMLEENDLELSGRGELYRTLEEALKNSPT